MCVVAPPLVHFSSNSLFNWCKRVVILWPITQRVIIPTSISRNRLGMMLTSKPAFAVIDSSSPWFGSLPHFVSWLLLLFLFLFFSFFPMVWKGNNKACSQSQMRLLGPVSRSVSHSWYTQAMTAFRQFLLRWNNRLWNRSLVLKPSDFCCKSLLFCRPRTERYI